MTRRSKIGLLLAATAVVIVFGSGVTGTIGHVRQAFLPSRTEEGRVLFAQICRSCHSSEPGRHKTNGPSLFGVVGRAAGSASGFEYSDAMKEAHLVWDDDSLDRYLADTKNFIHGNVMPYSLLMGTENKERRRNVIAYLHTLQ
jgi:cytochrome c2